MNTHALHDVVLAIAQQRSVDRILRQLVSDLGSPISSASALEPPLPDIALVRIWLLTHERDAQRCELGGGRCLHMVASAGQRRGQRRDGAWTALAPECSRSPSGGPALEEVLTAAAPHWIDDLDAHPAWAPQPTWAVDEELRSFLAFPLRVGDDTLGVLEAFSRARFAAEDVARLQTVANHAAAAIANARAFEQLQELQLRLQRENHYLREEVNASLGIETIVSESAAMRQVIERAESATTAAVLITGEIGTGKELLARRLHQLSERRERVLVRVDCAMPAADLERELLGDCTVDAAAARASRLELADGGTLLLDSVGELSLALQARLAERLRAQRSAGRGVAPNQLDVRLLATTHRDLRQLVADGKFHPELFSLIGAVELTLPPLRQRPQDLTPLARYFAQRAALRLDSAPPSLDATTAQQLASYSWPGNVRELRHWVEREVLRRSEGPLRFTPPTSGAGDAQADAPLLRLDALPRGAASGGRVMRDQLKQLERASIIAALQQSRGKVFGPGGAAELLGMKPTTLASRLKALEIPRLPDDRASQGAAADGASSGPSAP
jgi:transcriptional regulator with GAF, ATPase, and Fis domain